MKKFKDFINESGSARLFNIMAGLVPTVRTVGILTWENPQGIESSDEFNKKQNQRLEKILSDGKWGFTKIKGKYGQKENSFFVNNIKKEDLLELGFKGNQGTVIFGEVIDKEVAQKMEIQDKFKTDEYFGMVFHLISTEDRNFDILSTRYIFINVNDAEDFFSEIKGRKFSIPFFDVDYKIPSDDKKKRVVDYSKATFDKGTVKGEESRIEEIETVKENLTTDQIIEIELLQNKALKQCGSSAWITRARIKELLKR